MHECLLHLRLRIDFVDAVGKPTILMKALDDDLGELGRDDGRIQGEDPGGEILLCVFPGCIGSGRT